MADDVQINCPFEGPEKLLEIWFAPSADLVPDALTAPHGRSGLRAVDRQIWEDMLDIVKCKVLSTVHGDEIDAYLLSESSLFISPHRLILKTCGTTLNLLGLPRILDIARDHANMPVVHRLFYSRKSFMFPERQLGPHREWMTEVKFLDAIFPNGSAYTVGRVNGDHWLLYMTGPVDSTGAPQCSPVLKHIELPSQSPNIRSTADDIPATLPSPSEATPVLQDYTIEILMTHLGDHAREAFYTPSSVDDTTASSHGRQISTELGITDLFPRALTQLDAYSFTPCGYSSNALLKWGAAAAQDEDRVADIAGSPPTGGEGYYTIHVTPEKGWSYASFECNVPLPPASAHAFGGDIPEYGADTDTDATAEAPIQALPDLQTLIRRVVRIFQPGKITLTLFVSSRENEREREEDAECESAVEAAQKAFRAALGRPLEFGIGSKTDDGATGPAVPAVYRRTDKINYEFGGYDLAYASFELRA